MKRQIIKDIMFLGQKSTLATKDDMQTVLDLEDTLKANSKICVGMASNMIGVSKRIIAVSVMGIIMTMLNPEIIAKSEPYVTTEGCLSLDGERETTRYKNITVKYQDKSMKICTMKFSGFTAQIIQHEIDHCNGIII